MADKRMYEFTPAANGTYIYAEAADGSQVKIKKSDLIGALFQDRGTFENDANQLKTAGMYYITANTQNSPYGYSGLMLVFCSGSAVTQIVYSVFDGSFRKRALLYNNGNWDVWTNWK